MAHVGADIKSEPIEQLSPSPCLPATASPQSQARLPGPKSRAKNKNIQRERQYNKFQITDCNAGTSRIILRQSKGCSIYLVIAKGYPVVSRRGANSLLGASGKKNHAQPKLIAKSRRQR